MSAVSIVMALAVPAVAGFFPAAWLLEGDPEAGVVEKLAMGYGLGMGLLSFVMFLVGLAGIEYGVFSITLALLALSAPFAFLLVREGPGFLRPWPSPFAGLRGWRLYLSAIVAAWLLFKFAFVASENLSRPIFAWDSWTHWSTGAKLFFYERGLLLDHAGEFFFGTGYRYIGHPLLSPLLQAWTAIWLGEFHEVYVKAWSIFYFIGLVVIFYTNVRKEGTALFALAATYFLSSVPILAYHATEAFADLPLGYYGFASTVCLWRYLRRRDTRLLVLTGLFAALCVLTKNEGVFFLVAIGAALLGYLLVERRPLLAAAFWFLLPVLLVAGPWLGFKLIYGLGFGHGGFESKLTWFSDPKGAAVPVPGIHWEVLPIMAREFFLRANFNLIFPFWLIITFYYLKTVLSTEIKHLYTVILVVMAMFVFIYLVFEVTAVTESTGLMRNTITYLPIIFFTSSVLMARARKDGEETGLPDG